MCERDVGTRRLLSGERRIAFTYEEPTRYSLHVSLSAKNAKLTNTFPFSKWQRGKLRTPFYHW